jgi:MFS family permease
MRLSSRLHRRVGIRLVYVAGCLLNGLGFLLWGLVDDPTLISLLTVFEGMAFALLFTTSIVIVGRLLPPTLYSTGNSVSAMVGFGMAPIIGAGSGGFVYQYLGATQLFTAASALALAGAVVAWFALDTPRLAGPGRPVVAPTAGIEPEPGLVP